MKKNGNGSNHKPTEKKGIPITKCRPGIAVGALDNFRTQFDPRLGLLREFFLDPRSNCFHGRRPHEA